MEPPVLWNLFKSGALTLDAKPATYKVHVNADNPYDLYAKVKIQGQKHLVNSNDIHWEGIDRISKESLLELVLFSSAKFDIRIVPTQSGTYSIRILLKAPREPIPIPEYKVNPHEKTENDPTLLTGNVGDF